MKYRITVEVPDEITPERVAQMVAVCILTDQQTAFEIAKTAPAQLLAFICALETELNDAKGRLDTEGVEDPAVAASLSMLQDNVGTARRSADMIAQAVETAVFRPLEPDVGADGRAQ